MMGQLVNQLVNFRHHPDDVRLAKQVVESAVVEVLKRRRFLGEVLLQLPRQIDQQSNDLIGLRWQEGTLTLVVTTHYLQTVDSDALVLMLEHQALHVLWQHPLRYQNAIHPGLVKVATDVAVNQYLPAVPAGTANLGQLERLLHRRFPPHQDSSVYLRALEALPIKAQERLKHAGWRLEKHQSATGQQSADSHQGWRSSGNKTSEKNVRLAHLTAVVRRAYQRTPRRDRGLLPGDLLEQLPFTNDQTVFN